MHIYNVAVGVGSKSHDRIANGPTNFSFDHLEYFRVFLQIYTFRFKRTNVQVNTNFVQQGCLGEFGWILTLKDGLLML